MALTARLRRGGTGALSGLVAALTVLVLGLLAVGLRSPEWRARSSILVLPQPSDQQGDALAGFYDTLSRGQVPATYAELLRSPRLLDSALAELPPGSASPSAIDIEVVPDTSVIEVRATAPEPAAAEAIAGAVARAGDGYIRALRSPYVSRLVGSGEGTAERSGLGRGELLLLTVLLAGATGLVVQQLSQHVLPLHRPGQGEGGLVLKRAEFGGRHGREMSGDGTGQVRPTVQPRSDGP